MARHIWIWLVGLLILPLLLGLLADAAYALYVQAKAHAPGVRRASTVAYLLNPTGTPAVLMIHGFADGPSVFAKMAPTLAAAGLAVRALHLSGSGVPPEQMAGTTLAQWRSEIDGEIAALHAAAPTRPVWLVGHSLGGALAFDAALRPENRIAGLALLAPLVDVSRARSPLLAPERWFRIFDRLLVFSDVIESRLPADLHDPAARAAYRTDKYIHRDIYRALFATLASVRPRAGEWHGPLLTVVSPTDQIIDTAAAKFFFAATNATPAKLQEQPAAGHVMPLDNGHERLAAKLIAFIQAHPAPSP